MCTTCGCGEGNLYIEGDEHNPHSAFRSAPFAPAPRQTMTITGVKTDSFSPTRSESGDLHYGHGEAGTHAPGQSQRRMLEVEIDVLDKNNRLAARNRARFAARGQLVLNLVSSPGSGKTTLLSETLLRLKGKPPARSSKATSRRSTMRRAFAPPARRLFRSIPAKAATLMRR
jgi:hydrogenase nickel incorporation protein HypB